MEGTARVRLPPDSPFHPIVDLSAGYEVLDLSKGGANGRLTDSLCTVGRYDEDRAIYTAALFSGGRSVHMGIDIGAPAGTPVFAFERGAVACQGINAADGDYGPTIITQHLIQGRDLWVLHGHLSAESLALRRPGDRIEPGEVLGWLGRPEVNGGWPPHVHIQLSVERPLTHDMPGAVSPAQRAQALVSYPDPRTILGPLY